MPIFTQRLPDGVKRRIRDAIGLLGVEVIARRSDKWLRDLPIRTVIDVGANRGQFARTARGLWPNSQIYSFEPLEDCYREIERAFGDDPRLRAFNLAIGAEEGTLTMHRSHFDASSSLLPTTQAMERNFPFATPSSEVAVAVRRLDDACRDLPLEPEVLVKIDVQGYEDKVIAGGETVLRRARLILTEVSFESLYDGQPLFDSIYAQLTRLGFRYLGNWEQIVSPLDGRVLQADALFSRS